MKSIRYHLMAIMLLTIVLVSCKKDSEKVVIETKQAKNIYYDCAVSGGNILFKETLYLSEVGLCWSKKHHPTRDDNHSILTDRNKINFDVVMNNLDPGTYYYYRAYAVIDNEIIYGNTLELCTKNDSGKLINDTVYLVTLRSAFGNISSVQNLNDLVPQKSGFCFANCPMPTISDSVAICPPFSYECYMNFWNNNPFYVRSFIQLNNGEIYYGNQKTIQPQRIDVTAVDRITFRSARIVVKHVPHPKIRDVVYRKNIFDAFTAFPKNDTTFSIPCTGLQPNTTYTYSLQMRFYLNGESIYDNITPVTLTTGSMPDVGNGSYDDPYTIDGVLYNKPVGSTIWIEGFIAGIKSTTAFIIAEPPYDQSSYILVTSDSYEEFIRNSVQIMLPAGAIRDALNLQTNPGNLGRKIKILGQVYKDDMNFINLINITDYELN